MIAYDKVPWRTVDELLREAGSAPAKADFLARSLSAIEKLVPADCASACYDTWGRLLVANGMSEADKHRFNDYYRFRPPSAFGSPAANRLRQAIGVVAWREHAGSEFASDFIRPLGVAYSLVQFTPGMSLFFSLKRSARAAKFTDAELATVTVVNHHLSNYYMLFDKLALSPRAGPPPEAISQRFPLLTRREAEIVQLVSCRLSASEIAASLFLSRRTVDHHLASIYGKLSVRGRVALIATVAENVQGLVEPRR